MTDIELLARINKAENRAIIADQKANLLEKFIAVIIDEIDSHNYPSPENSPSPFFVKLRRIRESYDKKEKLDGKHDNPKM